MKYLNCSKVVIDNNYLLNNNFINLNIVIEKNNKNLIQGTVYNPDCQVVKKACIQIIKINKVTKEESILGYCFTNDEGKYGFTVEIDEYSDYIFNVYSSL